MRLGPFPSLHLHRVWLAPLAAETTTLALRSHCLAGEDAGAAAAAKVTPTSWTLLARHIILGLRNIDPRPSGAAIFDSHHLSLRSPGYPGYIVGVLLVRFNPRQTMIL